MVIFRFSKKIPLTQVLWTWLDLGIFEEQTGVAGRDVSVSGVLEFQSANGVIEA
jgi:hypothetical protein